MERVSFDIERQDVADALHAEAAAHGRSVEEELAALVERTYGRNITARTSPGDGNWVRELVELARELDLEDGLDELVPPRKPEDFEPPKL